MIRLAFGIAAIALVCIAIYDPQWAGSIPAKIIIGFQETMKGAGQ